MIDGELDQLRADNRRYLKLIDRNIVAIVIAAAVYVAFTCLNLWKLLRP